MSGSGWTTLGTQGTGDRQFNEPSGIFVDGRGRIYVADRLNQSIVRVDDMTGAGWVYFSPDPIKVFGNLWPRELLVTATGRIYVADGNNRVVRMDDMTGRSWTTLGPFEEVRWYPSDISIDEADRIYVADWGNNRIVRVNDMTGKGWVTLPR